MKNKLTKCGLFGTILVFLVVFGCKQDDFYHQSQNSKQEMKLQKVSLEDIMKKPEHKRFKESFIKFKEGVSLKSQNIQGRLVYNEEYRLYIDDENGVFIEKEGYRSYTFRIERPESDGKLENIVFVGNSNEEFDARIVVYDITYEEFETLGEEEIMDRAVEYFSYDSYQAEMLPGLDCTETWSYEVVSNNNGEVIPNTPLFTYAWVLTVDCVWDTTPGTGGNGAWTGNGNGDSSGNGNSNGNQNGGGGNNNGNNNTVSPLVTTPVGLDGAPSKKECTKIAKVLNDNPEFKQKLLDLAAEAPTATNEKAIVLHKDGTDAEYTGQSGMVEIPPDPSSKYTAMAHNHDGQNTYSVFSSGDFGLIGLVDVAYNKLDIDKFVSFLVTAKGTRYAFTINNKAKFRSFYEYIKMKRSDTPLSEYNTYVQMLKKIQTVLDKYYDERESHPVHPLIKETSTNTTMDLLLFVKFLEEADMGISIFEVDENFENFKEVKKNPNDPTQVSKSNCK